MPLRIGLTGHSGAGGSGIIAGELARLLARRGHEVHFIADAPPFRCQAWRQDLGRDASEHSCSQDQGPRTEHVRFHEVDSSCPPPLEHSPYTLALAARMAEVSRRFRLDVLHVHYALPHAAAAVLARAMLGDSRHPSLVTTLHGTDVTTVGSAPALYRATAYGLSGSDAVTAVSPSLARRAHEIFPDLAHIEVIPNFIDLPVHASPVAHAPRRPLAQRDLQLVHVSNFRPIKRAVDTVHVLAAVQARRAARLLLIGDGPELKAVCDEAPRLGVGDRVQALRARLDVHALLAQADVLLLPSADESFGLAALEALACGVPVVTSDVGGLADLVDNGKSGYRVAPGDTAAMASGVLRLAADAATLDFHRDQAYRAAQRFDAEHIVPLYESLYRRMLV